MARVPAWAENIGDLQQVATRAHGHSINLPHTANPGNDVKIGIIDSVARPPLSIEQEYNIIRTYSAFSNPPKRTTPHGSRVFNIIASYAIEADYYFYQAVGKGSHLPTQAYSDVIDAAIEDNLDILNVSAGDPWLGGIRANPNVRITRRAIDNGITVVAAAGNFNPEGERPPIHCPAAFDPVIAVGGMVAECPAEISPATDDKPKTGPYYVITDEKYEHTVVAPNRPFCSYQSCVDEEDCIQSRVERPWKFNPSPTDDKPDVLAPVFYPVGDVETDAQLGAGTSYAAPVVTGALATAYGELLENDQSIPSPQTTKEAIIDSSTSLDRDSPAGKMNALRLTQRLQTGIS